MCKSRHFTASGFPILIYSGIQVHIDNTGLKIVFKLHIQYIEILIKKNLSKIELNCYV